VITQVALSALLLLIAAMPSGGQERAATILRSTTSASRTTARTTRIPVRAPAAVDNPYLRPTPNANKAEELDLILDRLDGTRAYIDTSTGRPVILHVGEQPSVTLVPVTERWNRNVDARRARATCEGAQAIVEYDQSRVRMLSIEAFDAVRLHELVHHAFGHVRCPTDTIATRSEERAADCGAIRYMQRGLAGRDMAVAFAAQVFSWHDPASETHDDTRTRRREIMRCPEFPMPEPQIVYLPTPLRAVGLLSDSTGRVDALALRAAPLDSGLAAIRDSFRLLRLDSLRRAVRDSLQRP
jgi:hypothetical protein